MSRTPKHSAAERREQMLGYWDGRRFVPAAHQSNDGARPTTISFDPVETTRIRLDMTSRHPGTATGFLQIAELQFPGVT